MWVEGNYRKTQFAQDGNAVRTAKDSVVRGGCPGMGDGQQRGRWVVKKGGMAWRPRLLPGVQPFEAQA